MAAVQEIGYNIKPLQGIEFTKDFIFNDYVEKLFQKKQTAQGAERWICKQMLNCLYGVFGRKPEFLETIQVPNTEIEDYAATNVIKAIIPVNPDISSLVLVKPIDYGQIKRLNITVNNQTTKLLDIIKTNVAVASAITSYARIIMLPFKLTEHTVYTDTDSVITTKPLPDQYIGTGLGLFKEVLNGCPIKEAYFLGAKQYGY